MKGRKIYLSFLAFCLFLILFIVYQWANSASLVLSNVVGHDLSIKIGRTEYLISKRHDQIDFSFFVTGKARIEILNPRFDYSENKYCEIVNKPFGRCAFQVVVNENGISCGPCFSL